MHSKRLLTSNPFLAPIATFLRCRAGAVERAKKYETASRMKDRVNARKTNYESDGLLPSRTDSETQNLKLEASSQRSEKTVHERR